MKQLTGTPEIDFVTSITVSVTSVTVDVTAIPASGDGPRWPYSAVLALFGAVLAVFV